MVERSGCSWMLAACVGLTPVRAWAQDPPPPDSAVLDAAWEGVVGYDVVLQLRDGQVLEGRVSAVQRTTFTLIDFAAGGVVRVLDRASIRSMRVQVPGEYRESAPHKGPALPGSDTPRTPVAGRGLIAGGVILLLVGVPVLATGIYFIQDTPMGVPVVILGGSASVAGIGLTAGGIRKRRLARQPVVRLQGGMMVRRGSWGGGLTLRF